MHFMSYHNNGVHCMITISSSGPFPCCPAPAICTSLRLWEPPAVHNDSSHTLSNAARTCPQTAKVQLLPLIQEQMRMYQRKHNKVASKNPDGGKPHGSFSAHTVFQKWITFQPQEEISIDTHGPDLSWVNTFPLSLPIMPANTTQLPRVSDVSTDRGTRQSSARSPLVLIVCLAMPWHLNPHAIDCSLLATPFIASLSPLLSFPLCLSSSLFSHSLTF